MKNAISLLGRRFFAYHSSQTFLVHPQALHSNKADVSRVTLYFL